MFNFDIKYVEKSDFDNLVLSKKMEVGDTNIFLILDINNKKVADLLLNKIIDLLVENLDEEDIYNSFSNTLEKINIFLKEIRTEELELNINLIIGVLDLAGNLYFSKIGKSSVCLVRNLNEISEITDRKSKFEEFTFVSSGKLEKEDLIFFSNRRLLNYLAKSDLIEVWDKQDLDKSTNGIVKILLDEKIKSNISFISLKFLGSDLDINEKKEDTFINFLFGKIKEFFNFILKKTRKILKKNKLFKNLILIFGIFISIYILYFFISSVLNVGSLSDKIKQAKTQITQAKQYISKAKDALDRDNKELFNLNITKASEIVKDLKEKRILRDDVKKISNDISLFQKEFNKVETYALKKEKLILDKKYIENPVKILSNNRRIYIIGKKEVIGPVIEGIKTKVNTFEDIGKDNEFIDAIDVSGNILLLTKNNRIVKFSGQNKFSYVDVSGQEKWENAKIIKSFGRNIYLVERKTNQIYKHVFLTSNSYKEGIAYIKKENLLGIGKILALGIDGGFYILNEDLKIKKYFKDKNTLNTLDLARLPLNFKWDKKSKLDIVLPDDNKFLYLLMNNKIWIFKVDFPGNNRKVRRLIYVGQIETEEGKILSFIPKEENFIILTDMGVYKVIANFKRDDETGLYSLELID